MLNVELVKTRLNDKKEVIVSGRELHEFLEVGTEYKKWLSRMVEYGFEENNDFVRVSQKCHTPGGVQEVTNHALKLDMAKEIAMIQRSEKGKQARQYFLEIERKWNSPEMVMKRALEYANEQVARLENTINEQAPKVVLAESIENSNSLILIRDLAKIIKQNGYDIGEKRLFKWLRENGFLTKNAFGYTTPTQKAMNLGVFRVVETTNVTNKGVRLQVTVKVTGKGQSYFVNKFIGGKK